MIIDVHAHVWPDHIAAQVTAAGPAGLPAIADGTVAGLLRTMDAAGIDMACTLGVANVARTVARTNEFIGGLDRSRLIPFGTVHPDLSVEENLKSLADNGIAAVKFHPNFQQASLADPRVVDIMTALAANGIVVLTHAGQGSDAAATERGKPAHVAALVTAVPDLTLIACHFGGYHLLDDAQKLVVGQRVVLETSWPPAVGDLDGARIKDLIERHGTDRVVFGSDWPMAHPGAELETVRSWGLSPTPSGASSAATSLASSDSRVRSQKESHEIDQDWRRYGFLGRRPRFGRRPGRARRPRLSLLRPSGRADDVDPQQAARARSRSRLHHRRP